ncbi:MAG: hypothetical protein HY053_02740 [Proteobacteria bacterium]|nr:hypothetical protein [Pseudomonadota bacterium]
MHRDKNPEISARDIWSLRTPSDVWELFLQARDGVQIVDDLQNAASYYVVSASDIRAVYEKVREAVRRPLFSEDADMEGAQIAVDVEVAFLKALHETGFRMIRDSSLPLTPSGEPDLGALLGRTSSEDRLPRIKTGGPSPLPKI